MDESKVELRYVYTRESYIAATKDYKRIFPEPLPEKLKGWIILAAFIALGVLPSLYYVWLYIIGFKDLFADSWILWLYGAVIAIALWDLVKWVRNRLKPPAEYFDKDERWKGERHWTADNAGTHYEDPLRQSSTKWGTYHSAIETSTAYLFMYGVKENPEWFYVPKYAFQSAQQEELFKSILRRNVEFKEMK